MAVENQQQPWAGPEISVSPSRAMSEEEFVAWCDEDTRAEWVNGEAIMMSPANIEHILLSVWLLRVLAAFVDHHSLGVLMQDAQLRLPGQRARRVPDLLFVAQDRQSLIGRTAVEGPPDLIVEIVSPDSLARDWREKHLEYQAAGVREYWVIDPASQHMEAYVLDAAQAGSPYRRIEEKDGVIESVVLAGLKLRTAWLWPASRPKVLDALREIGVALA